MNVTIQVRLLHNPLMWVLDIWSGVTYTTTKNDPKESGVCCY